MLQLDNIEKQGLKPQEQSVMNPEKISKRERGQDHVTP